jgi:uncharacterized protein (DUF2141 family)
MIHRVKVGRWFFPVVLLVCACASGPVYSQAVRPLSSYTRVVDSFEVRDSTGRRYAHPFTGGFNVPRPQLADLDGDGDFDLLVQERSGEVSYFERSGSPAAPQYSWRTDRFQDLEVGEWFRLVDLDQDGDLDILAEEKFSYVRVYRNEGGKTSPRFVQVPDSLRETSGTALFADRQNIPNISDIDCNGRLDLFVGRVTGTVDRYEAEGRDRHGLPSFTLVTPRFEGIEIIGAGAGSWHGANTLALADYDTDGDQDLFWGDFFEPGLLLIENRGSCAQPNLRTEPVQFPVNNPVLTSGYNAPTFGDVNGDGKLDLIMGVIGGAFVPARTAAENLYYLEQVSPRVFEVKTRQFLTMIDVGSESVPSLVDLDGDGDLDLLLANKLDPRALETSRIYRFENTGGARQPVFQLKGTLDISGDFHLSPSAGDLDGDGDQDLVVGNWRDRVLYYRNEGTRLAPRFVLADSALVRLTRGSNTLPTLGDLDGDGDLDLLVGEGSGTLNYYRNTGTPTAPLFELVSDEWSGIDPGRRSAPQLIDLDRDGDLDLLVGSEAEGLKLYRNAGSRTEPSFNLDSAFNVPVQSYATPAAGDMDGDGDVDLFVGGAGGGLLFFQAR